MIPKKSVVHTVEFKICEPHGRRLPVLYSPGNAENTAMSWKVSVSPGFSANRSVPDILQVPLDSLGGSMEFCTGAQVAVLNTPMGGGSDSRDRFCTHCSAMKYCLSSPSCSVIHFVPLMLHASGCFP